MWDVCAELEEDWFAAVDDWRDSFEERVDKAGVIVVERIVRVWARDVDREVVAAVLQFFNTADPIGDFRVER